MTELQVCMEFMLCFLEFPDVDALFGFQSQAAVIQRDAICWLHTVVPGMFDAKPQELNFWFVS